MPKRLVRPAEADSEELLRVPSARAAHDDTTTTQAGLTPTLPNQGPAPDDSPDDSRTEPIPVPQPHIDPVTQDDGTTAREPSDEPQQRVRARSASELTEFTVVRQRSDRPDSGWRRALFLATGGRINPGLSPAERRRQELALRVRRALVGPHRIAVTSMKGGVGKTTVSAALGLMLAEHRNDRVVVLDANPDAGTLADRLVGGRGPTVRDLLSGIDGIRSLSDMARFTTPAGRLHVIGSDQDPAQSAAFTREEYEQVCSVLGRFFDIIVTDSGTGMVHSAMEGTLALADTLIVVGALTVDGASRAAKTLDWLVAHGFDELVARSVVVLSADRTSPEVDTKRLWKHFERRCRGLVRIPRDPHLATGGRIDLASLEQATADAFLEVAALVADEFTDTAQAPSA